MEVVGIICEYNPFHNGHKYHLEQVKKKFPDALIILCLNGYFMQRGEVSILSKEDKVKIALEFGVDLVVELPFIYGTQSADYFAYASLKILSQLGITHLVFGSESSDIEKLKEIAATQLKSDFTFQSQKGLNYPSRLAKSLHIEGFNNPNDLLAISYLKEIEKNHYSIIPVAIQRTSSYHDLESDDLIISASNIRQKKKEGKEISKYVPFDVSNMVSIDEEKEFLLLSYQILTNPHLDQYLDVIEGLDDKLRKEILSCSSLQELLFRVKSKRYTYNKIQRMFLHVLTCLPKDVKDLSYIRILGFNLKGKEYLHQQKKKTSLPLQVKKDSFQYHFELVASRIYDILTSQNTFLFEKRNQPIFMQEASLSESNQK